MFDKQLNFLFYAKKKKVLFLVVVGWLPWLAKESFVFGNRKICRCPVYCWKCKHTNGHDLVQTIASDCEPVIDLIL